MFVAKGLKDKEKSNKGDFSTKKQTPIFSLNNYYFIISSPFCVLDVFNILFYILNIALVIPLKYLGTLSTNTLILTSLSNF